MTLRKPLSQWILNPWLMLIMAVALVGVLAWLTFNHPADASEGDQAGPPRQAIPVQLQSVEAATLTDTVRGVGTLRAFQTVELRPETSGRIQAIHFQNGAAVQEGQLLFELDDEKLRSQLAARQATLQAIEVRIANAQRTFDRQAQLAEGGVVSADQFDQAQAELDSALAERQRLEAELELTQTQLRDMRITAPFAGLISERLIDRGAYVNVGQHLATLYQSDPVEVGFSVPERHRGRIQPGQDVQISVAAYGDETFHGLVSFISPAVDEATRTLRVRAQIPNPDQKLAPGTFATAFVVVDVHEDRPVVAAESLVATRTGYIVYVVEDETAHRREVSTGLRRDGVVEITHGLEVGEQVVRTGHLRLSDGDAVAPQ